MLALTLFKTVKIVEELYVRARTLQHLYILCLYLSSKASFCIEERCFPWVSWFPRDCRLYMKETHAFLLKICKEPYEAAWYFQKQTISVKPFKFVPANFIRSGKTQERSTVAWQGIKRVCFASKHFQQIFPGSDFQALTSNS